MTHRLIYFLALFFYTVLYTLIQFGIATFDIARINCIIYSMEWVVFLQTFNIYRQVVYNVIGFFFSGIQYSASVSVP